LTTMHQRYR